jgi:hypothetical protein
MAVVSTRISQAKLLPTAVLSASMHIKARLIRDVPLLDMAGANGGETRITHRCAD